MARGVTVVVARVVALACGSAGSVASVVAAGVVVGVVG